MLLLLIYPWYISSNHLDIYNKQCPEPLVQEIISKSSSLLQIFPCYSLKLKFGTSIWILIVAKYSGQFVFPQLPLLVSKISLQTQNTALFPDFTKYINHEWCFCVLCALKIVLRSRNVYYLVVSQTTGHWLVGSPTTFPRASQGPV